MRIKRFIAPDMRTALRMVRDEQGPDAVILSNRPIEGGIEIVAATDYDESLAQQALRAAVPALASQPMPSAPVESNTAGIFAPSFALADAVRPDTARAEMPSRPVPTLAAANASAAGIESSPRTGSKIPQPAIRGRAVFAIDGDPIPQNPGEATQADAGRPDTSRFDAMMAMLMPGSARRADKAARQSVEPEACAPAPAASVPEIATAPIAPVAAVAACVPVVPATSPMAVAAPSDEADEADENIKASATPILRAVGDSDPAISAMREELSTMRQLIERELGQFAVERLRGSPARAAAYDALIGYGCDETLALSIAGSIDARLDPAQCHGPMLAAFARQLTIARHEPLDDGGVIALVGPTGAGKTTTVAKLAARYAQRHRARDVALITTDTERPGATEQLHMFGRRLGITVCEANGANALGEALDQLADYPMVLIDTAGHGLRDRALLNQILWLRSSQRVRSLLVLPATTHPHDLGEVVRRYRPVAPNGVVLTKLDETGRLGSALSVMVQQGLSLAYTTAGQQVPTDIEAADAARLVAALEKVRRAAVNPLGSPDPRSANPTEDRHAIAC